MSHFVTLLVTSCQGQPLNGTPFVEARAGGCFRGCSAVFSPSLRELQGLTWAQLQEAFPGFRMASRRHQHLPSPGPQHFQSPGLYRSVYRFFFFHISCFFFFSDKSFLKMWSLEYSTAQNSYESFMFSKPIPHPCFSWQNLISLLFLRLVP